jgi:NADH-quinone oxidoreductase subunit H
VALEGGIVLGAEPAWWKTLLTNVFFLAKTFFFILVFMLVRWTVPRFRYDQVMDLGWKIMIPTALVVIVATALTVYGLDVAGVEYGLVYGLVLTAVNLLLLFGMLFVMDRGRILAGSGSLDERRIQARERLERRRREVPVPAAATAAAAPVVRG